jgi:hypothetical protein
VPRQRTLRWENGNGIYFDQESYKILSYKIVIDSFNNLFQMFYLHVCSFSPCFLSGANLPL